MNEQIKDRHGLAAVLLALVMIAVVFLAALETSSAITVNGTVVNYNRLQFVYTAATAGDMTVITWSLCCTRTNSSCDTFKNSAPTVVIINGNTVVNKSTAYDVCNGTKTLCNGSVKVERSNGAALIVPFSCSVDITGTGVNGNITVSGNIILSAYTAGTTTVTVPVDWIDNDNAEGARPEEITVTLYQNGTAYKETQITSEETEVTFTKVPKAYGGTAYTYTVSGSQVENYSVSEPSDSAITYIYNIVPEMKFRIGFSI